MKFKNFIILSGFACGCYILGKHSGIVKTCKVFNETVGENHKYNVVYDILKNKVRIEIISKGGVD